MRVRPAGLLATLVWFTLVQPAAAVDPTWVAVSGPPDWQPAPGYTLEIGDTAWAIDANNGGGVTTVDLSTPTIVRVRRLLDCVPVVRFAAQPGSDYVIRFAADGHARVEDWTGQGMDTGPALGGGGPPVCPRLPDTSTQSSQPSRLPVLAVLATMLLGAGFIALVARRHRDVRAVA